MDGPAGLGQDLPQGAFEQDGRVGLSPRAGWTRVLTGSRPAYWLDAEGISRGSTAHATLLWADVTEIDESEPPRVVLRTVPRPGARVDGRTLVISTSLLAIAHPDLVDLLRTARAQAAQREGLDRPGQADPADPET